MTKMQSSSNNSFIPKRKSAKRQWVQPGRRVYVLTIVAYSFIFASLLAAGGSFLYKNYIVTQLETEVVLLDGAVNTFSVQDFSRVQEFNEQLTQASDRLQHTVSIVAILDEIDQVVAQPIQIETLKIERVDDTHLQVAVNFITPTIDAALFQRKILNTNSQMFSEVEISEVNLRNTALDEDEADAASGVVFAAAFTVPVTAALFDPQEARRTDVGTNVGRPTLVPVTTAVPSVIETVDELPETATTSNQTAL
jgi:hypothetical protein